MSGAQPETIDAAIQTYLLSHTLTAVGKSVPELEKLFQTMTYDFGLDIAKAVLQDLARRRILSARDNPQFISGWLNCKSYDQVAAPSPDEVCDKLLHWQLRWTITQCSELFQALRRGQSAEDKAVGIFCTIMPALVVASLERDRFQSLNLTQLFQLLETDFNDEVATAVIKNVAAKHARRVLLSPLELAKWLRCDTYKKIGEPTVKSLCSGLNQQIRLLSLSSFDDVLSTTKNFGELFRSSKSMPESSDPSVGVDAAFQNFLLELTSSKHLKFALRAHELHELFCSLLGDFEHETATKVLQDLAGRCILPSRDALDISEWLKCQTYKEVGVPSLGDVCDLPELQNPSAMNHWPVDDCSALFQALFHAIQDCEQSAVGTPVDPCLTATHSVEGSKQLQSGTRDCIVRRIVLYSDLTTFPSAARR